MVEQSRQALRLVRTEDPASEPVTLEEAKSHLRVDASDDDTLIEGLITAARQYYEDVTRRALITQTWRLSLDRWPGGSEILLPRAPLQSVTSVVYTDSDGTATTWSSDEYAVDADSEPGRVVLGYGYSWPSATLRTSLPIQITYEAGYGDADDVPEKIKQAIKLLVGHWYENREGVMVAQGVSIQGLPLAIDSLVWANRVWM